LSDFTQPATQKSLHQYDLPPPVRSSDESVAVPILKPENIGTAMAIDEKHINGKFYTILTNHQSGKIALMAATHRKADLDKIMQYFGDKRWEVKTLTRDLSNTYDWLGREHFLKASHVADKFHIIRYLFDALHDVRIFYRQKLLTKKREQQEQKLKNKKEFIATPEETLPNGDTHAELLARSIHLLYKHEADWSSSQAKRAKVLFEQYPDIQTAYRLAMHFRQWYAASYIGKSIPEQKRKLADWIKEVKQSNIPEMLNFAALVTRHEGVICNYFIRGFTNAKAEAKNRIIQSLISNNVNTRNMDFVHFRLSLLLT
jgi:transposase